MAEVMSSFNMSTSKKCKFISAMGSVHLRKIIWSCIKNLHVCAKAYSWIDKDSTGQTTCTLDQHKALCLHNPNTENSIEAAADAAEWRQHGHSMKGKAPQTPVFTSDHSELVSKSPQLSPLTPPGTIGALSTVRALPVWGCKDLTRCQKHPHHLHRAVKQHSAVMRGAEGSCRFDNINILHLLLLEGKLALEPSERYLATVLRQLVLLQHSQQSAHPPPSSSVTWWKRLRHK